jgi:protein ImuA
MQGFKAAASNAAGNGGLSLISEAFPNQSFPVGAVHEFLCNSPGSLSASSGFVAGISSYLMKQGGAGAWVGSAGTVFAHGLNYFGVRPEHFFFIEPGNEKQKIWTIEEALKCDGLSVVIADINTLGFMESRRFQLAAEQSGVTCFLFRRNVKSASANCAVARWLIEPVGAGSTNDLPGIGFPEWNVSLQKIRNGKPGNWKLQWRAGRFEPIQSYSGMQELPLKKVI